MKLRRVTREQLRAFVAAHHRHAGPPRQAIVKVGIDVGGELVAVGCGSSPVARALDDGVTIEISRVCARPGSWPNACSRIALVPEPAWESAARVRWERSL